MFVVICPLLSTAFCAYNQSFLQRQRSQNLQDKKVQQKLLFNTLLLALGFILSIIGLGFVIMH